jgi:FdhD protein
MEWTVKDQQAAEVLATRVRPAGVELVRESLAREAPLQVRINGEAFTVTMRTPGEDQLLVRGLLHTEGILLPGGVAPELAEKRHPETGEVVCIAVSVPAETIQRAVGDIRTFVSASSCGLCGSKELPETRCLTPVVGLGLPATDLARRAPVMMAEMRRRQRAFDVAGGTHAAGLFGIDGGCLTVFEDIGRHNAVDKVVGWKLAHDAPDAGRVLAVSGRVSWEIVLKAWRAGLGAIVAVSAPSDLAVETARRAAMVLVAFCREDRATVYTHPDEDRSGA